MRIIITAAGGQEKWDNYLDVPSHLVPLKRPKAEPLLHRTVRQALEYTDDVWLTAPKGDPRYDVSDKVIMAYPVGSNEYTSTRGFWSTTGRTVILLGDVFFSDEAMQTICTFGQHRYRCFGRFKASSVTGTPYGEIFAASWWPENHRMLDQHLAIVEEAKRSGACKRPAGWALLRSIQGTPLTSHQVQRKWFEEINDWTDDIDFPQDYKRHPATR